MEEGRYTWSGTAQGAAAGPLPEDLEEFRAPLRVFAARRLGNWAAAEDVSQEVLRIGLEALNAGRIPNADALPGFLFQTAVHVCMHRGRSAAREHRALRRFASPAAREAEPAGNPLDALISAERAETVREALGKLDAGERELLELTYRDELSSEAIGRRLGVTPGAVRVRRHRALRRLGAILGVTPPAVREFDG